MRRAQLMGLSLAGVLALGAGAPAVALATQGFTGGGMAATVQANEDWHQFGTCLWRITDGLLEVKPANGANGILDGFGWKDRAAEIPQSASSRALRQSPLATACSKDARPSRRPI